MISHGSLCQKNILSNSFAALQIQYFRENGKTQIKILPADQVNRVSIIICSCAHQFPFFVLAFSFKVDELIKKYEKAEAEAEAAKKEKEKEKQQKQ